MFLRSSLMFKYLLPFMAAAGEPAAGAAAPAEPVNEEVTPKQTVLTEPESEGDDAPEAEEGADGAAEAAAGDSAALLPDNNVVEPETPAAPKAPTWQEKELRRKHAQNKTLKQENEELKALLARRQAGETVVLPGETTADPPAATTTTTTPAAPTKEAIDAAAAAQIAQRDFEAACNDMASKGQTEYKDKWNTAIANLETLGGVDVDTISSILATDNPAKVLFELGSDPENFQKLMELPPARRTTEFVKMGLAAPKKKVSAAPPPPAALGGRGGGDTNSLRDDLPDDEWNRRREEQRAAAWKKKQQTMVPAR